LIMYCVYMHTNRINGKKYIGMTNDCKRRWRPAEYKPDGKQNERPFYNAIRKYGFDSFRHEILIDGLFFEDACREERRLIAEYDTTNRRKGYNVAPGGNGGKVYKEHPRNMLGQPQTEYQKAHQKAFMLDKDNNPMKNGTVVWGVTHPHPRGFKGKKKSQESKEKVSKTLKEGKYCCKPVRAVYPDGSVVEYESTKAAEAVGLTKPVILRLIRSKMPFEVKVINQYSQKNMHLNGIRFEYVDKSKDNTEVTSEIKDSLAP